MITQSAGMPAIYLTARRLRSVFFNSEQPDKAGAEESFVS
jgi:hypothetical protein